MLQLGGVKMIYLDKTVDIPVSNVYFRQRGPDLYICEFIEPWKDDDGSRKSNRKRRIIGVPVNGERTDTQMHPNENYYKLRNLALPEANYAKVGLPGKHTSFEYAPGAVIYPAFPAIAYIALLQSGLYDKLIEAFKDSRLVDSMCFIATVYASGRTSLEALEELSTTFNAFNDAQGVTSQAASYLMRNLDTKKLRDFFKLWIPYASGSDCLAYDVTAFTSKAKLMREAEYGYTHGTVENLPLVNYALFSNERTGIPVFFDHYSGSLTDKANLKNIIDTALDRNLPENITLVMDRGMTTLDNLRHLKELKLKFIVGVPGTIKAVDEYLSSIATKEQSITNTITLKTRSGECETLYCYTEDFIWNDVKLKLHLYQSVQRRANKMADFFSSLEECKRAIADTKELPSGACIMADVKNCFVYQGKGRGRKLVLDEAIAQKYVNRLGTFALFSEPEANYTAQDALEYYRRREIDEANFDILKNDLNGLPLGIHNQSSLDGKFFILFIALVIKRTIMQRIRGFLRSNNKSYKYAVETLNNIKVEFRESEIAILESGQVEKNLDYLHQVNAPTKFAKSLLAAIVDPDGLIVKKSYLNLKVKRKKTKVRVKK